jgi:hypothetical protein
MKDMLEARRHMDENIWNRCDTKAQATTAVAVATQVDTRAKDINTYYSKK